MPTTEESGASTTGNGSVNAELFGEGKAAELPSHNLRHEMNGSVNAELFGEGKAAELPSHNLRHEMNG